MADEADITELLNAARSGDPDAGDGWTDKALLRDPPEIAPPVYVGAMGPKMLQMTGRFADVRQFG